MGGEEEEKVEEKRKGRRRKRKKEKEKKKKKRQQQRNCSLEGARCLSIRLVKKVGDNPLRAGVRGPSETSKRAGQRANVRPPGISGLWGALLRFPCQMTTQSQ